MLRASIIIPTYKRENSLLNTLRHLVREGYSNLEIIVIDQSPPLNNTELKSFIRDNKEIIRYIVHPGQNASSARNRGLAIANGDIVICCDDDIIPSDNFIKGHVNNYIDPKVGAVSGRTFCPNDIPVEKIKSVGRLRRWDGKVIANFNADFRCEIEHIYGCNSSFRRELLRRVGGYDERLRGTGSFDDADVAFKIRKLGFKIMFDPQAMAIHVLDRGGYRDLDFSKKMYWYYHNFMIFNLKHMDRIFFPIFLIRQILGIFVRSVIKKDLKIVGLGFRGLIDGARDYIG